MEIVPTVSLPVAETHAATRRDLRRAIKKVSGKQELKWVDAYSSNVAATTAASTVTTVNGIAQGTTTSTRVGNQVTMTSVQAKFTVHIPNSGANGNLASQYCRLLVVCDNESVGAAGNLILDSITVSDLTLAPYNLNFVGKNNRFKILFDRRFQVNVCGTGSTSATQVYEVKVLQFKKAFKRIVQFIGTTSAAGDIGKNSIGFLFYANNTVPLLDYGFRCIYKDD